ncbi:MAG: hypothetical protein V7647_3117 [Acidobacteriota bacterium]|jgi:hypothetical protein
MQCGYCDEEAISRVPAIPPDVCHTHALEFWTGLLTYAKANPPEPQPDPPKPTRAKAAPQRQAAPRARRPAESSPRAAANLLAPPPGAVPAVPESAQLRNASVTSSPDARLD